MNPSRFPSLFEPWYIVFKVDEKGVFSFYSQVWDSTPAEMWTTTKGRARICTNVRDAARIAGAEQAMVRLLFTADEAKEFGHDGT